MRVKFEAVDAGPARRTIPSTSHSTLVLLAQTTDEGLKRFQQNISVDILLSRICLQKASLPVSAMENSLPGGISKPGLQYILLPF